MKTHLNGHQPKELSDAEFEAALHAVLRDEGYLFPRNAEDVASLRTQMDMNGVPTPDTEKFRQLLRQTAALGALHNQKDRSARPPGFVTRLRPARLLIPRIHTRTTL